MNRSARKIIMIVAASVFVFSSAMVLKDYLQMKAAAEFSESISEMVVDLPTEENDYEMIYNDITDESETVQSEGSKDITEEKSEDAPIQVDFNLLGNQNQDIVAWLYCPDIAGFILFQSEVNAIFSCDTLKVLDVLVGDLNV